MPDSYHTLIDVAEVVAFAAAMLIVVGQVVSRLGGWASLAEPYRWREPFEGPRWRFQSGQFRWLAGYNNCLTVGADARGLFLSIFPLFRAGHPPLFIPWSDISLTRKKVLWVKQVQFRLGRELQIPFTIPQRLAQKLQTAAGSAWPRESESKP